MQMFRHACNNQNSSHVRQGGRLVRVALACVATLGAGKLAGAAENTSLYDHPTIAPLMLMDGAYSHESPAEKKGQCVKVKAKLETKRLAFKASSEWRAVTGSDAYKTFADSHKGLQDKKCAAASAGPEQEACKALTDKVVEEANALSETTQWKAMVANKSYSGLMREFASAQKQGCIKPKPAVEAVK